MIGDKEGAVRRTAGEHEHQDADVAVHRVPPAYCASVTRSIQVVTP
jgi:hypothetical protein